jgi:autotransporter-associated beta strand protein
MFSISPLSARGRGGKPIQSQRTSSPFRPRLEILEDRCLPATVNTWQAIGATTNWNNPANWSLGHVPDSGEIANFMLPGQAPCFIDAPVTGTNAVSGLLSSNESITLGSDLIVGTDGFFLESGSFFSAAGTTITDAGDWDQSSFGQFDTSNESVNFVSTTSQTITADNASFLNFAHHGSGSLILAVGTDITLSGDFFSSGGILNAQSNSITLTKGNWNQTDTVVNLFSLTFDGSAPQTLTANSAFTSYNLTYSGSSTLTLETTMALMGSLTVSSGTFDANNFNVTIGGSLLNSGTVVNTSSVNIAGSWLNSGTILNTSNVSFNGPTGTTQLLDNGGRAFSHLIHTGAGTLMLSGHALIVNGPMDSTAGSIDSNGLPLIVEELTTIIDSLVLDSGGGIIILNQGVSMVGGSLSSGRGRVFLGGDVAATSDAHGASGIDGFLDLGSLNRTFAISHTRDVDLEVRADIVKGGFIKEGSGALVLEGPSEYSGGTTVKNGSLTVSADNALGAGPVTLSDGTKLAASASVTVNNPVTLNGFVTVFVPSFDQFTVTGVISGPGGFVMTGPGDLVLKGNNTYSGMTTLNGGSLIVSGQQPANAVVINSGASLTGVGVVGPVTVNNGGILEGVEIQGNVQFNRGGTLRANVFGLLPHPNYTSIRVHGAVSLGFGIAILELPGAFTPTRGDRLRLISNLGSSPISGFFAGIPEGTIIESLGTRMLITYQGGTGTDLVATAVPFSNFVGRASNTGEWWLSSSNGSSFTNQFLTTWNPAATWVDVHTGGFQGIGAQNFAGRYLQTGQWWVAETSGNGYSNKLWGTWNPNVTWVDVQVGDFNGDGLGDIVGRVRETGQWWIAESTFHRTGIGTFYYDFTNQLWGTWNPGVIWSDVHVGDFNGDGKADIAGRYLQGGSWWTGISTGSGFATSMWSIWNPLVRWTDVNVGDFNGDGMADIAGMEFGHWWVGLSTGSSFANTLWASWMTQLNWVDIRVGDFNGDGKADLAARSQVSGVIRVDLSIGTSFTNSVWTRWNPAVTWADVQVGDFNGDGMSDITGRVTGTGQWWVAVSNGSQFTNQLWTTWSTAVTWVDVAPFA